MKHIFLSEQKSTNQLRIMAQKQGDQFLRNFDTLAIWANFQSCKWPDIQQIIEPSGHTAQKTGRNLISRQNEKLQKCTQIGRSRSPLEHHERHNERFTTLTFICKILDPISKTNFRLAIPKSSILIG